MINKIIQLKNFVTYQILKRKTKGVRISLYKFSESNELNFLLVKHRYNDFWTFPGGGIKKSESITDAGQRELEEETGYLANNMWGFGRYKNFSNGKSDYVYLLISNEFKKSNKKQSFFDRIEIEKSRWFSCNKLPVVSEATSKRIKEIESCLKSNIKKKTSEVLFW